MYDLGHDPWDLAESRVLGVGHDWCQITGRAIIVIPHDSSLAIFYQSDNFVDLAKNLEVEDECNNRSTRET
jgi:hypothetical protein